MRQVVLTLLCTLPLLAGCNVIKGKEVNYHDNRTNPIAVFNGWGVEDCRIAQHQAEITLSTDGDVDHETLRIKLYSNTVLMFPPQLGFNTFNMPIVAEGRGQVFAFELPYTSYDAASWVNDNTFLMVTYQPGTSNTLHQQFFPLGGLAAAMAYQSRHCPQKKSWLNRQLF